MPHQRRIANIHMELLSFARLQLFANNKLTVKLLTQLKAFQSNCAREDKNGRLTDGTGIYSRLMGSQVTFFSAPIQGIA